MRIRPVGHHMRGQCSHGQGEDDQDQVGEGGEG